MLWLLAPVRLCKCSTAGKDSLLTQPSSLRARRQRQAPSPDIDLEAGEEVDERILLNYPDPEGNVLGTIGF